MISQGTLFDTNNATQLLNNQKPSELLRTFEDIHNHIYANEGFSAEQAFSEILKLLFTKVFDEKTNKKQKFYIDIDEYELCLEGKAPEGFIERIVKLHKKACSYFSGVITKNENIDLKIPSLAYAVQKLQHIDFANSPKDVKGLAFQKFVYSKQRTNRGQFFTPEPVIRLCVQIIKPSQKHKVLDPTCGTGGFLSKTIRYVLDTSLQTASEEEKNNYIKNNIFGIEINPMVAKIAKMRLLLEGDGYGNIINTDALSDWSVINHKFGISSGRSENYRDHFDIILTNPPFGSQGRVTDRAILRRFDLGHKWEKTKESYKITNALNNGQVPDILFIERCLDLLKRGGRLAIVLPNGDLENTTLKYVRHFIKKRAKVIGVVKLPNETFIPFGTGVKTSVILLKRTSNNVSCDLKKSKSKIFFSRINKIGYKSNKSGSAVYQKDDSGRLILDKDGNQIVDEDISKVIDKFSRFESKQKLKDCDDFFELDATDLLDRFDTDYYLPSYRKLEQRLTNCGAKKFGQIAEICKKRSPKLRKKNLKVEYIELSDINTEYMEISRTRHLRVHELPSRAAFELKEGDIITAVSGNSIGTEKHMSALVTNRFTGTICSNGFRVIRHGPSVDPYYILFYLRNELFLKQISRYRTGSAIPAISDEDLYNILVYLPTMNDQQVIAEKVKKSFELREQSKKLIWEIKLKMK